MKYLILIIIGWILTTFLPVPFLAISGTIINRRAVMPENVKNALNELKVLRFIFGIISGALICYIIKYIVVNIYPVDEFNGYIILASLFYPFFINTRTAYLGFTGSKNALGETPEPYLHFGELIGLLLVLIMHFL